MGKKGKEKKNVTARKGEKERESEKDRCCGLIPAIN